MYARIIFVLKKYKSVLCVNWCQYPVMKPPSSCIKACQIKESSSACIYAFKVVHGSCL